MNEKTQQQSDQDLDRSRDLSAQPSTPPAKLAEYTLERFIGAGAYGEVWSGTEKKTGRRVAIKFFTRRSSDDVELLAREVEKLVTLSADRNVVQLIDVDWQAEPPYFVMDYFENGSLEDLLKKEPTLPLPQAESLFTEIATGMMQLHGKGIFHCDLKPGNILLDAEGNPRLADFGQARVQAEKVASLGTLFFMAPEQADLTAVPAAKWDVYALGALLYCMLVGHPPYRNQALSEKIDSVASVEERLAHYKSCLNQAPHPTEHRDVAGVDNMLAEIIDKSIAVNPRERFDSVESILHALRQREIAKARKPLLILGLIGPLLLLMVMSLFSWIASRQAYADTEQAIRTEAITGNQFAANLAARSATEKMDRYFRAVQDLALDKDFVEDLLRAISDPELREIAEKLDDPNRNSDPTLDQIRQDYRDNAVRSRLQRHLEKRISDPTMQYASWFVNDIRGMQIASVFDQEPDTITLGRNYSYRTYFTGFGTDLKRTEGDLTIYEVQPRGVERTIIEGPHLSSVFLSRGTFTWKVAFSTPVFRSSVDDRSPEIIGLVACTVEMGNFVEFNNTRTLYAMLLDGRDSNQEAVILEHPVFARMVQGSKKIPRIHVDLQKIASTNKFDDPLGKLPDGRGYDRHWIASVQPVSSPRLIADQALDSTTRHNGDARNTSNRESGLFVVVGEDYGAVIQPVDRLGSRLFWLAMYAIVFFLIVALTMWLLVLRMLRDSKNRLMRSFSGVDTFSIRNHTDSN